MKKFDYKIVNEIPECIVPFKFYIEGEKKNYWILAFRCPCGCNDIIFLNLLKDCNPHWIIKLNWLTGLTIYPSIKRNIGCRSHFNVKNGKIIWCNYEYY